MSSWAASPFMMTAKAASISAGAKASPHASLSRKGARLIAPPFERRGLGGGLKLDVQRSAARTRWSAVRHPAPYPLPSRGGSANARHASSYARGGKEVCDDGVPVLRCDGFRM